jgi:hypothetical protein
LKQYVTYDKKELENTLERIRYAMYFMDSEIRSMERVPEMVRRDGEAPWLDKKNWELISEDLRKHFKEVAELMKKFNSEINFDFEPVHNRKVLTEKS